MPKRLYFIATFFIIIASFVVSIYVYGFVKNTLSKRIASLVLGTEDVTVTTTVKTNKIYFKVFPEKRIPPVNNWSNSYSITLQNCNTNESIKFENVSTQDNGIGMLDTSSENVLDGEFRFIVQGMSHLIKRFDCVSINSTEPSIDLTINNQFLKAGQISIDLDNYVNALDISELIDKYQTSNIKSDLNRDGLVNSLDLSVLVGNLFLAGD